MPDPESPSSPTSSGPNRDRAPGPLRHPLTPALSAMWIVALVSTLARVRPGIALWALPLPVLVVVGAHWLARERFRIWRIHHERRLRAAGEALGRPADEPTAVSDRRAGAGALDAEVERLASSAMQLARNVETAALEVDNLRGMLDGVDDPVLAIAPGSRVLLLNIAAQRLLGQRSAPPGQETLLEDLLPQPDILRMHAKAARGEAAQAPLRLSLPGVGLRVYNAVAAPVPLAGPSGAEDRGVVICLHDTTELSQAVQLKTDFVANASHELRTPLSAIRGAAETLADISDDPGVVKRMVEMIGVNVTRLEELTSDLLDMSRIESPDAPVDYATLDLHTLGAEFAELFAGAAAERRVGLKMDLAPELVRVRSSRMMLEAALKNLIDNALKFAEEGTDVVEHAAPIEPDAGASPSARADWCGCRIEVIDRGIGIPHDQQSRVFERFHQVDPSRAGAPRRRGTGLGLAIVKHAVRKLGGRVGVESVWKQGSTIWIELPNSVDPDTESAGQGQTGPD